MSFDTPQSLINHNHIQNGHYIGHFGGNQSINLAFAKSIYNPGKGLVCYECSDDMPLIPSHTQPKDVFASKNPICPVYNPRWEEIITFDPHGMYGERPTISATRATMDIPEIKQNITVDGKIVCEDKTVNCIKIAIEPVWNIPKIAERIRVSEIIFRRNLYSVYKDPKILTHDIFLPPVGGSTIYVIGDLDTTKTITSRVHDECIGSDVFGTDICTCRPYLTFSIEEAVRTAQSGGCGVICYNRKEGRSLGETIKFLVYNSRATQDGGDRPDTYFDQTTAIAGVPDARMQRLMPDIFLWLGIDKIYNWISMSNDKSGAIRELGIHIENQYEIPKHMIPKQAHVEINAKIQSGYFSSNA
jgi:GTP cyclohydrolase II